jgi:autotransporter-associated beta strand protein
MKNKQHCFTQDMPLVVWTRSVKLILGSIRVLTIIALLLCASGASAQVLTWDAGSFGTNDTGITIPGSGAWDTDNTTNFNWNNGETNVSWTQGGTQTPTFGAAFNGPDAADGIYAVNVDGGQVSATNLSINANGYAFFGSPIDLRNANAVQVFSVADGKDVYFTNDLAGNNTSSEFALGSSGAPATVVLYGTMTGYQPLFDSTNGSVFYLAGGGSVGTMSGVDADVRMTNDTFTCSGAFPIGRARSGTEPNNGTGALTVGGTVTLNQSGDYLYCGRDGAAFNATLIVQDQGTLNDTYSGNFGGIGLPRPASSALANARSVMRVYGGTVNMGSSSIDSPINIANAAFAASQYAELTQTGGVINAWGGIVIGGGGTTLGTAMVTNSGGFLYLGSQGGAAIRYGSTFPATNMISLSGGTVGALQNWISSAPMMLNTINGNITFQTADSNGDPYNIGLSGALTGPGGFYQTGGGTLTLSGANNYAGITTVSNGTLVVSTAAFPTNGAVVLDGSQATSSGLPILSNLVASAGQYWTITNLTVAAGTPTLAFQFGTLSPSGTVAPIQDNGNLTFTVLPNFTVDGSAIPSSSPTGYPLIKYTGTYTGPASASLVYLPSGGISGYITNIVATKTIALFINSSITPNDVWSVGNGLWDIGTSLNWKKFGSVTSYHDGDGVQFDDTASGTSPITVTLNTTVNPSVVAAVNATKAYVISGTGTIAGSWIERIRSRFINAHHH